MRSPIRDFDAVGLDDKSTEELQDDLWDLVKAKYDEKEKVVPAELMRRVERDLMLQIVDTQWKDHLYSLDHLKEGIGLRGYGQRDPLVEYKKESFTLFQDMRARVEEEIVRYLWWLKPVVEEGGDARAPAVRAPRTPPRRPPQQLNYNDPSAGRAGSGRGAARAGGDGRLGRAVRRRPASAATTRRSRRCGATSRRSAATIRAGAAAGRSSRNVTGPDTTTGKHGADQIRDS